MIEEAAEAIRNGELVVFPTDTVYGIGCDPFNEGVLDVLFEVKKRDKAKTIPLLVDSIETAEALVEITDECKELMDKHWPGALTLVLKSKAQFSPHILKSDNTIAVRMPDHDDLLELISATGGVLAATSANISGKEPALNYDEAYATFSDVTNTILPGVVKTKQSSTIVDCTSSVPTVIRKGAITL